MATLVGRDSEKEAVLECLDRASEGPFATLLEGEAGIGKTSLWKMAVAEARERGHLVLTAHVAEFETGLSFVGLADLFEDVTEEQIAALPPVQQAAINSALLRSDDPGTETDWRAVSAAVLGLLRSYAAAGPVVIGLDDIQWLDHASAKVLATALGRLETDPVVVVMTRRVPSAPGPFDPQTLFRDALRVIEVDALDWPELEQVIRARLGRRLSPPEVKKIHQASGGNPFYALEITRAVADIDTSHGDPLPIPKTLTRVISDRLNELSDAALQALLVVASVSRPTVSLVELALGDKPLTAAGIQEARRADVLEQHGDALRFTHPLFASTIYDETGDEDRRSLHERLSELVDDVEQRASHLARARSTPSEEVAEVLDRASAAAKTRGAIERAAELAWRAAEFTPEPGSIPHAERLATAAEFHFLIGERIRLKETIESTLSWVPDGRERARLLIVYSELGSNDEAIKGLTEALAGVTGDPVLETAVLRQRAQTHVVNGNPAEAEADARAALAIAEATEDRNLIVSALYDLGTVFMVTGDREGPGVVARACAMPEAKDVEPIFVSPLNLKARLEEASDNLDGARKIVEELMQIAQERGDTSYSYGGFLFHLVEIECRAGRLARADRLADELVVIDGEGVDNQPTALTCYTRGLAHVLLGRIDEAKAVAERGASVAEKLGDLIFLLQNRWVLGLAALSAGDYTEACRHMGDLPQIARELGARDPNRFIFDGDLIEALIGAGRVDEAEERLEDLQLRAEEHERVRALAIAARCRGMLANHRGQLEEAGAALSEAIDLHDKIPDQPFELARTLLTKGIVERRAKQRRSARESLGRAREIFTELGNPVWAEKAAAEATRFGGRAPSPDGLTPTEDQVARLVAEGLSNKEVAERLFLSIKTVEANLSRIYRKLDVKSRTQLAQHMHEEAETATQT